MNLLPVLKKQSKDYSFNVNIMSNDKPVCSHYVYLKEQVIITWNVSNKNWEYYALKEDDEFGLMTWVNSEGTWKRVSEDISKAYSDYIAEKALLKE